MGSNFPMHQLRLLDVHDTSPKTLSPERMSHECAREVVESLFLGDFEVNNWQRDFILDMHTLYHFTLKQRKVIYNLGRKFRLI